MIKEEERSDKRDNFVKLNRDHHQQFPHYIRARHPHNHKLAHNIFLIISNINVFIISTISLSPGSLSLLLHRIPKHLNQISEVHWVSWFIFSYKGKPHGRVLGVQPEFCRKGGGGGFESPCQMGCGSSSVIMNPYWETKFASYFTIIYHDLHQNPI